MNARKASPYGRDKGAEERASAPSLRAAFPKVTQLRITFTFDNGLKASPSSQVHTLHPPSQAYFNFPCPAPGCSGADEAATEASTAVLRTLARSSDTPPRRRSTRPSRSASCLLSSESFWTCVRSPSSSFGDAPPEPSSVRPVWC